MVARFGLVNAKLVTIPMELGAQLGKDQCPSSLLQEMNM
jgi:hypothetical protein